MGLVILRCIFLMVSIGLGVVFINSGVIPADAEWSEWMFWGTFVGMLLLPAGIVMLDVCIRQKQLDTISSVYFGMIVGLFMAYVASLAMTPLFYTDDPSLAVKENLRAIQFDVQLVLGLVFCYVCVSLLMQTKHDFRFIIPYVEFAREFKGIKSLILDTSVVIDGRIADVIELRGLLAHRKIGTVVGENLAEHHSSGRGDLGARVVFFLLERHHRRPVAIE